jgi:hypothetical protein
MNLLETTFRAVVGTLCLPELLHDHWAYKTVSRKRPSSGQIMQLVPNRELTIVTSQFWNLRYRIS